MRNKENILLGLSCFFGGMVAGFLIAPIKKGISCGNNSGNNVNSEETLERIIGKDMDQEEKDN